MEPMSDRRRAILRKSRVFLVPDMDLGIVDHLVSELILTEEDEERINAEKVRHDKVRKLIDLLPRRGDGAYNVFMRVLQEQQSFLYEQVQAVEAVSDDALHTESTYYEQNGASGDLYVREDASLIRQNQNTRGVITHPTDGPAAKVNQQLPPAQDVKPFMQDVKANMAGNVKTEPMDMDSFGFPPVCLKITGPDQGQRIDPMCTVPLNPQKIVPQKALSTLASNLGHEWEALAIHMGFQNNRIYHFKENSKYNVWGQVFAFLSAWRSMKGVSATIEKLIGELKSFKTPGVSTGAYRHLYFE